MPISFFDKLKYMFGPSPRRFGIELEFSHSWQDESQIRTILRDKFPGWVCKNDSSICPSGTELVSPPLYSDATGLHEVTEILLTLQELRRQKLITLNKSCGLHVHVEIKDLKPLQIIASSLLYGQNEYKFFNKIMKQHRNDNSYCYSNKNIGLNHLIFSETSINKFCNGLMTYKSYNLSTKYRKLNTKCKNYNTVEFRHHHATFNINEVTNWIIFSVNFINLTKAKINIEDFKHVFDKKEHNYEKILKIDNLLLEKVSSINIRENLPPNIQEYYNKKLSPQKPKKR